ncbi:transcription factor GTE1 [Malania oleifera]|uniref:transcription factor GTE1 n=1 Tax=Malania oleifera TaxID=397392 RepID=UPI0025AE9224|nr:transcription factor GTE1 [Malania oleifera]
MDGFMHYVDEILTNVDKLEQRVTEIEHFYLTASQKQLNTSKGSSEIFKDKDMDKSFITLKKQQQGASNGEATVAKRMPELMNQFAAILHQITQHKWAGPFMQPVDVEGLGLHDYYEVIDKPMDLGTIKNQMEAKDATGYKNVRDMQADVRLVFKNAIKYNDERSLVYVMAKTLLENFDEKCLQLLPKVIEEETRQEVKEEPTQLEMELAQDAVYAQMTKDIRNEICEVDKHLEELREMVVREYSLRKMRTEDKKKLAAALTRLSAEGLREALEIVAQNDPTFQATAEEVDLDMDAQSESTLWKLKCFVKDALKAQGRISASSGGSFTTNNNSSTRKQAICAALAETACKRGKH